MKYLQGNFLLLALLNFKDSLVQQKNEDMEDVRSKQNLLSRSYYEMGLLKFKEAGKHKTHVSIIDGNSENVSLIPMNLTPIKRFE